jgi:hypothetical protein
MYLYIGKVMATKTLIIGNESFNYPVQGTSPVENWGEEASAFAEAVANALANVQAPNDILLSTYPLLDNVTIPANIVGLKFPNIQMLYFFIEYGIKRVVGSTVYMEDGTITGYFDGTDFYISTEATGDAQVNIAVTSTGQFTYTSSNLGQTSAVIRFKASTIAN